MGVVRPTRLPSANITALLVHYAQIVQLVIGEPIKEHKRFADGHCQWRSQEYGATITRYTLIAHVLGLMAMQAPVL